MASEQQNNESISPQQPPATSAHRAHHKVLIAVIGGALLVVAVAIGAAYALLVDTSDRLLADSLRNTLAIKQSTYVVSYENTAPDAELLRSITFEGKYNASIGHEAQVNATIMSGDTKLALAADAVLDTKANAYVRYKNMLQPVSGETSAATNNSVQEAMKSEVAQQWTKSNIQGFDTMNGCELSVFQKLQSNPNLGRTLAVELQDSEGLEITEKSSSEASASYTIKAKANKLGALVTAYKETDFYKSVVACSPSEDAAMAGLGDLIKYATFDVKLDKNKRLINELIVSRPFKQGGMKLRLTLKPATDVKVTIPKESVSSVSPLDRAQ